MSFVKIFADRIFSSTMICHNTVPEDVAFTLAYLDRDTCVGGSARSSNTGNIVADEPRKAKAASATATALAVTNMAKRQLPKQPLLSGFCLL